MLHDGDRDEPLAECDPAAPLSKATRKRSSSKRRVAAETTARMPVPVWLRDVAYVNDPVIPVATRLGQEMLQYCDYTARVMETLHVAIDDAVWGMTECVQAIWPEASVTCFGSYASGLWLPSSDVDVVVMGIPQLATSHKATHTNRKHKRFVLGVYELELIADALRQQPWVQAIEVVASAKVPVAKLVLAHANDLRVDISIEDAHTRRGMDASALVREYITAVPILYPLILVVKQFLREKGLNSAFTGGLSSYCVALMAVYLVEKQHATAYVGADVGQLLLDFVEFYGTMFSYGTTGISLKPDAFGEYYLGASFLVGTAMPQLVIDDPVYEDGAHNAAAGAFAIARVVAAFENAFYAVSFHHASRFTPSPLSQLLHWSGFGGVEEEEEQQQRGNGLSGAASPWQPPSLS
jgi:non-canonical poly(A) RNA polymerase PAPD5/7